MQPANVTLNIVQGATLRDTFRVMQSQLEYRPITGISSTAPVVLSVDHGLPTDWPVWVQGVQRFQELNRAINQTPHFARVMDAESLEINAVSAINREGDGGLLLYHPPVDLTGATALLQVLDEASGVLLEITPTVHAGGWVDINMDADDTEALAWKKGTWFVDITLPNGDVIRPFAGGAVVSPTGTSGAGGCNWPGWVLTFGSQGPAGAGDTSELLALIEAQQQQINELFDLIGGGQSPVFVLYGEDSVMYGDDLVISSGAH